MSVSVLILTFDEEANLPGCLESVAWSDDIVVFDSYSSDRTVEIAETFGARVFRRRFDDYGSQREAARVLVDYRHDWVLALDADERVDAALREEILRLAASEPPAGRAAYRVRRKDFFLGRWIGRATLYPSWFVRLYRPGSIRYEPRSVHEYPAVAGTVGELRGHLLHYSFNKGLSDWFQKHVRYARLEAAENLRHLDGAAIDWRGLAAGDPVRRRRALKGLSFRLPLRPLLRFAYMYFLRLGLLDGYPGFTYCCLLAVYEYLIVLNIREQRRRALGQPF
jgi:glycosyltransferase involved in cell wall biosynthesis